MVCRSIQFHFSPLRFTHRCTLTMFTRRWFSLNKQSPHENDGNGTDATSATIASRVSCVKAWIREAKADSSRGKECEESCKIKWVYQMLNGIGRPKYLSLNYVFHGIASHEATLSRVSSIWNGLKWRGTEQQKREKEVVTQIQNAIYWRLRLQMQKWLKALVGCGVLFARTTTVRRKRNKILIIYGGA